MSISDKLKKELSNFNNKVGIVEIGNKKNIIKDLRNKFIESGTINDPKNSYHMEISFDSAREALFTAKEIRSLNINCKNSLRTRSNSKKYIVYIKSGEEIKELINILGAKKTYKLYNGVINKKSINQDINRIVNFEMSNIKKAVSAGSSQLNDIKRLLKKYKLKNLDPKLQEVIVARKKNPELSLTELSNVIGNISKSALNHRLAKIKELAYESSNKKRR